MFHSVKNAVVSHTRKKRLKYTELEKKENQTELEITPETLLIRKEIKDSIYRIIEAMPMQAGLVFRLHKMEGFTYKEIAETLDLSVKTVENHMGRALRFFKDVLSTNPDLF